MHRLFYALKRHQCTAQGNALGRLKWSMRPAGAKASLQMSDEPEESVIKNHQSVILWSTYLSRSSITSNQKSVINCRRDEAYLVFIKPHLLALTTNCQGHNYQYKNYLIRIKSKNIRRVRRGSSDTILR